MERVFSVGTATIVALMAAHRLAQDHGLGDRSLDSAFREAAARLDEGWFAACNCLERETGS